MWCLMAKKAQEKLKEGAGGREAFYESKIVTARFFFERMLPEVDSRFKSITAGASSMMALDAAQF
jgi:hypothetical protein